MKESDILGGIFLSLGRTSYTVRELANLAAPFGIREGSLRTWLCRQNAKGFLESSREGTTVRYSLSDKGRRIGRNVALSFRTPDWSHWDGSWWGFLFSVPENMKSARHRIRIKLEAYRFACWYDGVWIRPRNDAEGIHEAFGGEEHGRLIVFRAMEGITPAEARRLWKIAGLADSCTQALIRIRKSHETLGTCRAREAHVRRIETGDSIVSLLNKDPLLPPSFYPQEWNGNELRKAFAEWDKAIREKARPFWQEALKEHMHDKGGERT